MNNYNEVWKAVLSLIKDQVTPVCYETWFLNPLKVKKIDNKLNIVYMDVNTSLDLDFFVDIINSRYLTLLQDGLGFGIPDEAIDYVDPDAPSSFETVKLFRGPAVWHPESYSGEYVLYDICKSEECCRKEITDLVLTFIERAVPYIQKLTL